MPMMGSVSKAIAMKNKNLYQRNAQNRLRPIILIILWGGVMADEKSPGSSRRTKQQNRQIRPTKPGILGSSATSRFFFPGVARMPPRFTMNM
jgi:hypothetical protein